MKTLFIIFYEKMSLDTPYSLDLFQIYTKLCFYNRVIREVRKTQNPLSLVIHWVRLKKNLQKSTLAFKGG
jgi:hypothetical protein